MNSVRMSDARSVSGARMVDFDWRKDLEASRDLMRRDMDAYGYVLSWIEDWSRKGLRPTRLVLWLKD